MATKQKWDPRWNNANFILQPGEKFTPKIIPPDKPKENKVDKVKNKIRKLRYTPRYA